MFSYDILFDKIALPDPARTVFCEAAESVRPKIGDIRRIFFDGGNIDGPVSEIASHTGMHADALYLAVCVLLSESAYGIYKEKSIDENIFYDTMSDITIWVNTARRDRGTWGLHNFGWLSNHLRATLFRLGRLQFERRTFRCDEYKRDGRTVRRGDPVMNIHIPEGDPITREKRFDSYRRAHEFFGLDVFVCDTWLFYPRHKEFLRPDSNILDFMRDFDIIESSEKEGDMSNMWRIFGLRDSYNPADLPRDTGMRRAYADWIAKENKTGSGYGVRFY